MGRLYSPQVRWARWQAKHALRAFLRRGLRGSFAFEAGFRPLAVFCEGEPSSVFCSAAMSSSRSPLYSGERDASSASGVAILSPRRCAGAPGSHGCRCGLRAALYDRRTLSAACSRQCALLGCSQQNGSANVSLAHGRRRSSGVFWSAITRALAARTGAAVAL